MRHEIDEKTLDQITTLEEARKIETEIKDTIQDIKLQLGDVNRTNPDGKLMTKVEHLAWQGRAIYAKMQCERQLGRLRLHMKKQWLGFGIISCQPPARVLTAYREAFTNESVSEGDILTFFANPSLIGKYATSLDYARGCAFAAPPLPRASMMQRIALVTRSDQDLVKIEEIWAEGARNPETSSKIGTILVRSYLAFDRLEDAEAVVENIPLPGEVAQLWLEIYRASRQDRHLEIARSKIAVLPLEARIIRLCILQETSCSTEGLHRIRSDFPAAIAKETGSKGRQRLVLVYATTLLKCGFEEDARQVVDTYAPDDPLCRLRIASMTRKRDDLLKATAMLGPVEKSSALFNEALAACLACDSLEIARAFITGRENPRWVADAKCQIALQTVADDDLSAAAESLVAADGVNNTFDWPRLVYLSALLKKRRLGEAKIQIAEFIQDTFRCQAYLKIHCAENGLEYPGDFER